MSCLLDYFPWEILHLIFDHLEVFDLLQAFSDVTPYLNTVFNSYSRMQLNLKSMKKSTFYFICEHVHPNQIQSLVLSDDEYTCGQIELFMSLLPLIQCINLQYLSINQIPNADLLYRMFAHLENHAQLRRLSITGARILMNKVRTRYIAEILTTLPSLKYLTLIDSTPLTTLRQPLSRLTHLTIRFAAPNDLRIIFQRAPNLLYLQITALFSNDRPIFDNVPSHLISLKINSKGWMMFDEVENLLSLTPSLKHLTLETMSEPALLDTRRWELLIKTKLPHLVELALNITPSENNITGDDVLTPFQSPFWTIEKHWSMACLISTVNQSCVRLFSVPHFALIDDWYPPSEGFFNYSLTPYSFNECCKELKVSYIPSPPRISSPFKHIHTLSLQTDVNDITKLHAILNLLSVNHLKLEYSVRCTAFHEILQAAPNINQVTMNSKILGPLIDSFPDDQSVFEQIKRLNMNDVVLNIDIDRICKIFPKLEHVSLSTKKNEDICQIFSKLQYLTSATIQWIHFSRASLSIIDNYLQENNICTDGTYQLDVYSLHIWID